MRSRRVLTTWLLAAFAALVIGPVAALATGPSAGDNQYTDPLGSSTTHTSTHSSAPPPTTTAAPATTPSSTATTSAPTSSTPTATTATATTKSKDPKSGSLPNTGYDAWLAFALGAGLVGGGVAVRRLILARASARS